MITVSCCTKKDIEAVTIIKNGVILRQKTSKVKDEEIVNNSYLMLIHCFSSALRMCRSFIEEDTSESEVIFEVGNTTFALWINQGYSKNEYQKEFAEMYNTLQSIPMYYAVRVNSKPYSASFCKESCITKVKLGGID